MSDEQQIDNAPADQALDIIWTGFEDFGEAFATITQRAAQRFEQRDWQGMQPETIRTVLENYNFRTPFENLSADSRLCAMRISEQIYGICPSEGSVRIENLWAPAILTA